MIIDAPLVVDAAIAWVDSPGIREMLSGDRARLEILAGLLIDRAGIASRGEIRGPATVVTLLALAETLTTMIAQAYLLRRPT